MDKRFIQKTHPAAPAGSIVQGPNYRFTVLTPHMIRMEYSSNTFTDHATQVVLNRDFPTPAFEVNDSPEKLQISTDYLLVTYDKKPFSPNGLTVRMTRNPYLKKLETWYYGDDAFAFAENLKGTSNTLDGAVGDQYCKAAPEGSDALWEPYAPVDLGHGLLSKAGFSVIDDSRSLCLDETGWLTPAPEGHTDLYFLCYGRDYLGCLHDFFHLSGKTPLLPRFVLGNWWSRYYNYTQQEFLELHDRFRQEHLPFSVTVLDMGWHLPDIDPKYGKGWTGYTWNREPFPNPKQLIQELHSRGMHFALNVHPADGVRAYEDQYPAMAAAMGMDPDKGAPIEFDVTNPAFWQAYFECLHHPHEEEGVDFWWIDWQQGTNTRLPGYDPQWLRIMVRLILQESSIWAAAACGCSAHWPLSPCWPKPGPFCPCRQKKNFPAA